MPKNICFINKIVEQWINAPSALYQIDGVTSLDAVVSLGCLARVPGRPSIRVMRPRVTYLELQGAVTPGSNPPGGLGLSPGAWGVFF